MKDKSLPFKQYRSRYQEGGMKCGATVLLEGQWDTLRSEAREPPTTYLPTIAQSWSLLFLPDVVMRNWSRFYSGGR